MKVNNDSIEIKNKELYTIFAAREILGGFNCKADCEQCKFELKESNSCDIQYAHSVLDDIIGMVFYD